MLQTLSEIMFCFHYLLFIITILIQKIDYMNLVRILIHYVNRKSKSRIKSIRREQRKLSQLSLAQLDVVRKYCESGVQYFSERYKEIEMESTQEKTCHKNFLHSKKSVYLRVVIVYSVNAQKSY